MTSTLRTQLHRSRQAHNGLKRVEVILDAESQTHLDRIKRERSCSNGAAIKYALALAGPVAGPEVGMVALNLPANHLERLNTLARSAGITRAQAVSMLLLDKGDTK